MNPRTKTAFAGILFALGTAPSAFAQDYDLSWNTVDGGGATFTSGGDFELSGTIAQPDAGTSSGGEIVLSAAFWLDAASMFDPDTCSGAERAKKAKCRTRRGVVRKLTVKATRLFPGQEYTVTLTNGEQSSSIANDRGKASFKFRRDNAPPCGAGEATLTTGEEDECASKTYDCGC